MMPLVVIGICSTGPARLNLQIEALLYVHHLPSICLQQVNLRHLHRRPVPLSNEALLIGLSAGSGCNFRYPTHLDLYPQQDSSRRILPPLDNSASARMQPVPG